MNQTPLNVLGILAMLVLAPMALASLLLITAYSIGALRVWRDDRSAATSSRSWPRGG